SASEKRTTILRNRLITKRPVTAVKAGHPLILPGDHANGHAAADDLPIRGDVRAYAEHGLCSARVQAETVDDFVKDEACARLLSNLTKLSEELLGLPFGPSALNGLNQHSCERRRQSANDVQRIIGAVVQHRHMAGGRPRHTWHAGLSRSRTIVNRSQQHF